MKIGIEKETVTMAEAEQAKEMINAYDYIDNDIIMEAACRCLVAYDEKYGIHDTAFAECLLGKPKLYVTKNHFELTIWCECIVKYWQQGSHIAELSFDLIRAYDNTSIDCCIQVFDKVASECI